MKLTYLGTAAAEGWPAPFCTCPACREARHLGGKNIRTRSQAMVNDDLLLDLCPDTYTHTLQSGRDFSGVKYLLVTHSHTDHFYPVELTLRGGDYAHDLENPTLDIYCNQAVEDYFYKAAVHELEKEVATGIRFHILKAFEEEEVGPYRVTALPARHMAPEDEAYFYLIRQGERSMLYAHDTGLFFPEVYDFLAKLPKPLDLVSLDCTTGPFENGPRGGHMGIPDNIVVKEKLLELGAADGHTLFIVNHFSHNGGLLYEELAERTAQHGMQPSYDGMTVEF